MTQHDKGGEPIIFHRPENPINGGFMKSPLYLLAVAAVSAPFFMGQAAPMSGFGRGGGGWGCSGGHDSVTTTSDTVEGTDQNNSTDTTTNTTTTQADVCPPPVDPLSPAPEDACQDRDFYGSVKGRDWSEEITSFFGRPADDACAAECGGTADHTPWTLSIRLSGTPFADGKSYSFSFMKDEWKSKVKYLEVVRDATDPDGCPAPEHDPCWKTCDGQCVALETVVKDNDTLVKEGETLLVNYVNDVCKIGITVEDLGSDTLADKIQAAADKATFKDILYCAEGILLTGTQVLDWVDTVSSLGLVKDETGADYTQNQLFQCMKKSMKSESKPAPSSTPPPPDPSSAPKP
jgi:hypothetical protein